jgi:hypothetical protein
MEVNAEPVDIIEVFRVSMSGTTSSPYLKLSEKKLLLTSVVLGTRAFFIGGVLSVIIMLLFFFFFVLCGFVIFFCSL